MVSFHLLLGTGPKVSWLLNEKLHGVFLNAGISSWTQMTVGLDEIFCEMILYSSDYVPQPENVHDVPRAPCPETSIRRCVPSQPECRAREYDPHVPSALRFMKSRPMHGNMLCSRGPLWAYPFGAWISIP